METKIIITILVGISLLLSCTENETPKKETTIPKKELKKTESPKKVAIPKPEAPKVAPIPPAQLKKAKAIIASVSEKAIAAVNADKKYKMLCASCHGFTGDLNVNGAKDLTTATLALHESVAQLYHGRGLMTPFKNLMSEAEIVAVAKYVEKELRK